MGMKMYMDDQIHLKMWIGHYYLRGCMEILTMLVYIGENFEMLFIGIGDWGERT